MKSLCIVVTVLTVAPMWAGLRIKSEQTDMKTGKVTSQDEILLDSERLRMNQEGGRAMMFLTDGGRDRMVILNQQRNEYQEIDKQTVNQLSQQMSGMMAQLQERLKNLPPEQRAQMEKMMAGRMGQAGLPAASKTTYVAKGSGSINGFSCTRYEEMEGAEKVADICSAKPSDLHFNPADFQVFERMKDFASGLLSANLPNSPLKNNYFMTPGIDGYPIERINYASGQAVTKGQLKSIDRGSFSEADFTVGNARKVDLFAGRGGRQ